MKRKIMLAIMRVVASIESVEAFGGKFLEYILKAALVKERGYANLSKPAQVLAERN
jgi:hypothetical protein